MMLGLLLVTAAAFATAAAGVILGRPALARPIVFAPLLAAFLVYWGVAIQAPTVPAGPLGKTWVTLRSMSFDMPSIGNLRLGGDAEADDIVVLPALGAAAGRIGRGRLPPGFLTLRQAGPEALELELQPQAGPGSRAVVRLESDHQYRYLGAVAAPPGLRPCLNRCDGPDPKLDVVRKSRVYDATTARLPGARGAIALAPGVVLFASPETNQLLELGAPAAAATAAVSKGKSATITIFEAAAGLPAVGEVDAEPGRLAPQKAFDINFDGRTLLVRLHTPDTIELATSGGGGERAPVRFASGAAAEDPVGPGETVAAFGLLGRSFDSELSQARLDVARDSTKPVILHATDGSQMAVSGPLFLGLTRRAGVEVRSLDLRSGFDPWIWMFAAAALVGSLAATWRIRLDEPLTALAFGALDVTLALRLLVAVEGAFVDAASKTQAAPPGSLIALPLGAFLALAAHPKARQNRFGLLCLAVITLAAVALTWTATGVIGEVAFLALALLPFGGVAAYLGAPQKALAAFDRWQANPYAVAIVGSLVILLLRLGLGAIGLRESVSIGRQRVALSLFFVPVTLAIAAPLIARAAKGWTDRSEARRASFALLFLTAFGIALPGHAVRDNGFVIFALPIVVGGFIVCLAHPSTERGARDLGPAALAVTPALAGLLIWVLGFSWLLALGLVGATLAIGLGLWWRRPAAVWLAPMAAVVSLLLLVNGLAAFGDLPSRNMELSQAVRADTNQARLFAVLAPARLSGLGTRTGDALQDTDDHMREYSATLTGRGYFNLPPPTVLKAYHLSDNVSAVHLISPFGRLGAAAFVVIGGSLAAAACAVAFARALPSAWLGALAALALSLVSAYMILANLLAAPFTGRNVYLLAAASSADLLEGLMLFILVVAALAGAGKTSS